MFRSNIWQLAVAVLLLALFASRSASAQVTISGETLIADTTMVAPGSTQLFSNFSEPAIDDQGNVAFWAALQAGGVGAYLYTDDDGLQRIADTSTAAPGPGGPWNFDTIDFWPPKIHNGQVVFYAKSINPTVSGIFKFDGTLTLLFGTNTQTPDGAATFTHLSTFPGFSDGNVVFWARDSLGRRAIYSTVGGLHVLVDEDTPVPGGTGGFNLNLGSGIHPIDFDGENAVFGAGDNVGTIGIYVANGTSVRVVADTNSVMPGIGGLFSGFGLYHKISQGRVAFYGFGAPGSVQGIFAETESGLQVLVRSDALIPCTEIAGIGVGHPAFDRGAVVFSQGITNFFGSGLSYALRSQDRIGDNRIVQGVGTSSYSNTLRLGRHATVYFWNFLGAQSGIVRLPMTPHGCSQADPILPTPSGSNGRGDFDGFPPQTWADPPVSHGYRYTMTSNSRFTSIMDFPTGFAGPFTVLLPDDSVLGQFGPGQSASFASQPGGGVTSFRVVGIRPLTDASDLSAFPLKLNFNATSADFWMIPILQPDLDADVDIDADDSVAFLQCVAGPGVPAGTGCTGLPGYAGDPDIDHDGDVDLLDFMVLQKCFSGPNTAPELSCMD